ncbi:Protein disulfide isomerase [Mycena sanguinolenta]|uniref:Protein disulfide isomerase n=1 Tax=Mycena sanguinolenta TaxID=230812 RepID=A0A8H6Z5X9_9AGAR|nr:Protein disulfide isomerase [Mycena sanguinolenta]
MFSSRLLLSLVFVPALVSAGVFPPDSMVKMLDAKSFKKGHEGEPNEHGCFCCSLHCQRLAPEYSKAALGLHPLIPFYAVDCDDDKNKRLCSEQGVKGFPTIKLFPKGKEQNPMPYDSERTASALYYFASRRVPVAYTKLYKTEDIVPWIEEVGHIILSSFMNLQTSSDDRQEAHSAFDEGQEGPTPVESAGEQIPGPRVRIPELIVTARESPLRPSDSKQGRKKNPKYLSILLAQRNPSVMKVCLNKFDSLSKFFDSVIDGTADLTVANEEAKAEEYEPTEEELEIQRKQEAQRMALLHGGYSDLIDFEQAILDGTAEKYHDTNGFGAPPPLKKKADTSESESAETESVKAPADETAATSASPTLEASTTPTCESSVCKNDEEL